MMTPIELCEKLGFRVVCEGEGRERELHGIYCCDLLITVMANINTIAVAVLSDVSCVLLSEGVQLDAQGLEKAQAQGVCVLSTDLPTFEASAKAAALFLS